MTAGLMAAARREGRAVFVLTMTAGELGTPEPDRWPTDRLAALRRVELRASLAAIGVHGHHVVGLPDGGCESYDLTSMIATILVLMRPATIVTFGPDGFTGHRDHRAVSAWVTNAWHATGSAGELWYATVTPSFHADYGHLNHAVDLWAMQDGARPCDPVEDLVCQIRLTGHDLDQKLAALRAHASQTTAMIAAVGEDDYRAWWSTESFRAAPARVSRVRSARR